MSNGKILVIDDEDIVLMSCHRALTPEGYNVKTAKSGVRLKMLENETFNLALIDVKMPDMDGMEVLKKIKERWPDVVVIIITGYSAIATAVSSIKLGAFDYIEKPFTPEFMINVAKRIFNQRGWILRKAFIDEFRNEIVSLRDTENPVIFYKEGTWARQIRGEFWEVGCDVRYWLLAGQLAYIELHEKIDMLVAGESFGKILSGTGQTEDLISPMTGVVKEINNQANEAMSALIRDNLSEGWLLWLARIQPIVLT
ncbi:MAG: response regulator [Thermodesulfovibrionales bacterium]|nr:response regulator [Thermodesulfovibrionales bacterium]